MKVNFKEAAIFFLYKCYMHSIEKQTIEIYFFDISFFSLFVLPVFALGTLYLLVKIYGTDD